MLSTITSAPIAHVFSPADWLRKFEALSGGYVVSDTRTSFCIPAQGVTLAKQIAANALLRHLTEDERASVVEHIRDLAGLPRLRWNRPVGKHVDIQRRRAYVEALEAYVAADAVLAPEDDDEKRNAIYEATSVALRKYFATRSPDLCAILKKMHILETDGSIDINSLISELVADVEDLIRRQGIGQNDAADIRRLCGEA